MIIKDMNPQHESCSLERSLAKGIQQTENAHIDRAMESFTKAVDDALTQGCMDVGLDTVDLKDVIGWYAPIFNELEYVTLTPGAIAELESAIHTVDAKLYEANKAVGMLQAAEDFTAVVGENTNADEPDLPSFAEQLIDEDEVLPAVSWEFHEETSELQQEQERARMIVEELANFTPDSKVIADFRDVEDNVRASYASRAQTTYVPHRLVDELLPAAERWARLAEDVDIECWQDITQLGLGPDLVAGSNEVLKLYVKHLARLHGLLTQLRNDPALVKRYQPQGMDINSLDKWLTEGEEYLRSFLSGAST